MFLLQTAVRLSRLFGIRNGKPRPTRQKTSWVTPYRAFSHRRGAGSVRCRVTVRRPRWQLPEPSSLPSTPYSVRFLNETAPNGAGPIYTVPAGYRAVVKCVSVTCGGTGPVTAQVYGGASPIYQATALAANAFATWSGHQVANSGERITTYCTGGAVLLLVSGYLLIDDGP